MIDDVVVFLEGKTVDVRIRLRERMQQASQQLDFERAAQLRDALKWLDQLEQPQAVELIGRGDADAVGLARDGDDVCGVVLRVRDGKLIARDHWFLENAEHETEGAILAAFLVRCYLPLEVRARRVLLPFPPDDLASLTELAPAVDWHVPPRRGEAAPRSHGDRRRERAAGRGARCGSGPRPGAAADRESRQARRGDLSAGAGGAAAPVAPQPLTQAAAACPRRGASFRRELQPPAPLAAHHHVGAAGDPRDRAGSSAGLARAVRLAVWWDDCRTRGDRGLVG